MSFAEDVKNEIAHYEILYYTVPPIVRQDWNSALPIMP